MNNKILTKLMVPEFEISFDLFIPINEIVWKIKKMIAKSISDITSVDFNTNDYILIDKNSSRIYKNNDIIINTDIRNTAELLFVSKNN